MLRTPLCELVGIEHPIIAAPMGPDLTGPELVAAVSNAGGLGILQAQLAPPPSWDSRRNVDAIGDIDSMDLLAGQSVGLVREIKPAGEIVRELVNEAQEIISRLSNQH